MKRILYLLALANCQLDTTTEAPPPVNTSITDTLEAADATPRGQLVTVSVELDEPGFDFKRFRTEDHDALIAERTAQLAGGHDRVEAAVRALGATEVERLWISPSLIVTLPAERVRDLGDLPGVRGVHWNAEVMPLGMYDGFSIRFGTQSYVQMSEGITGDAGSRFGGGPIRVGSIDSTPLPLGHVAFLRNDGSSRVFAHDCTTSSSTCDGTTESSPTGSHASVVLGLAAGSIECGLDSVNSGCPNNLPSYPQIQRSGALTDSTIFYYRASSLAQIRKAFQRAIVDKLDVLDLSIGQCKANLPKGVTCKATDPTTYVSCDMHFDNGMNGDLKALTDAGTLVVGSAGDAGQAAPDSCSLIYPNYRSEVLTVGGLHTIDSTAPYASAPIAQGASRGGMLVETIDGRFESNSALSVSAPFNVTLQAFDAPQGYSTNWAGTSFSAPIVAGMAGLTRENGYLHDPNGMLARDPIALKATMMLMADGYDGYSGGTFVDHNSDATGMGRAFGYDPYNLPAPSKFIVGNTLITGVGIHTTVVDSGAPFPAGTTEFKAVMTWTEPDLGAVSDITLTAIDTCHGNQVLAADVSNNLDKQVTITGDLGGKCLALQIRSLYVHASGTLVHLAYFRHG